MLGFFEDGVLLASGNLFCGSAPAWKKKKKRETFTSSAGSLFPVEHHLGTSILLLHSARPAGEPTLLKLAQKPAVSPLDFFSVRTRGFFSVGSHFRHTVRRRAHKRQERSADPTSP